MRRISILLCCTGAALTVLAQQQPQTPPSPATDSMNSIWRLEKINPDDDWTRHFRVGGMVALNVRGSFKMDGSFNISGSDPAGGIYDDGYVHMDNTGDAQGLTSYWGYNSSSQISGSTLTMHSAKSFTSSGSVSGDDAPYPGFDMAYGDSYWHWGKAKLGWELGFGLVPIHITDNQPMSATVTRSVYQFNMPTSTPNGPFVPPTAPYNGGPSGIGPLIYDTVHTQADETITSGNQVTGTRTLDATLYTLRLGPTLYWDLSERVGLYAGAGPAVGLVSGELDYNETILISDGSRARNTGRISGTDMTYGGYVNATVVYHVVENGDFYLGAQFMPMQDARISGAGREGDLNLGGQIYITAGINWPF